MFEGVIFDLDGLLVDSEASHLQAWNECLKQFDVQLDESEIVALVDRRDYDNAELFRRRYGLPIDPLTLVEQRQEIFMKLAEEQIEPKPGAVDLIKTFYEYGLKLALVSGCVRDYIYLMMDKMELADEVSVIVAGDMIDLSKPEPMPYSACAETFALHPSLCVVLDDSRLGVEAALNAGMKVICVPGAHTERWRITGADVVLNSLDYVSLATLRSLWTDGGDTFRPQLQPQLQPQATPRLRRRF